jgi:hypothetical protein
VDVAELEVEELAARGPLSATAVAAREAELAQREIIANDLRRQLEAQRAALLGRPSATGKLNRNVTPRQAPSWFWQSRVVGRGG